MPQIWVLPQDALLGYCTLYTDCLCSRTDAVARHVSFAQITCCSSFRIAAFFQMQIVNQTAFVVS